MKTIKFNQYIYIIGFTLIGVLNAGCKKFLEHAPDLRTQLNSKEKVAQLLTSAYPKADYLAFTELSSDNVEDKGPATYYSLGSDEPSLVKNYMFEDFVSGSQEVGASTDFYWAACYKAIASANLALDYIVKHPDENDLLPYKGEALVARAYAHFMLVSLYAKTFVQGGANNSAGIPYLTEVETVVQGKYERGTVADTYQKIEQDLTEGLPLIDNSVYKTAPKYHFTLNAANAFAARFYLFKGEFDKVITYAAKLFTSDIQTKGLLRPWNTTYINATDDAFEIMFTQSSQNANLLICESPSIWSRSWFIRYGMGNNARNNILEGKNISGGSYTYRGNPQIYPRIYTNKFKELFFETKIGSGFGDPYIMVPLFTTDELLMNRAEAYVQSNQYSMALKDINTFLSTRINGYDAASNEVTLDKIASYYNTQDQKKGLINTILDLKRAEFMQEGLRWFDLNRYGLPIKHTLVDNNNKLIKTLELTKDDPRRVFQLPTAVLKAGLELNPR
ncbi:RagB/SusD family nutrient uptake outer membrane protein [Pedobacter nototheniae]|uniref:RagB/SusD family nutrient uptake outer membrane protein n=1 Tax=Pedobacter nototheniae TaxID=2488994 RepID=UPI00103BF768|nr:RagB/SusD family nutrient uptake outer membrane protein [Pedobacter nototheniae]